MFFKIGDTVRWSSQAAGIERTKQGEVVRVLDEQEVPYDKICNPGIGRDHETYLIKASVINGSEAQKKRTKHYWPKTKYLELVK